MFQFLYLLILIGTTIHSHMGTVLEWPSGAYEVTATFNIKYTSSYEHGDYRSETQIWMMKELISIKSTLNAIGMIDAWNEEKTKHFKVFYRYNGTVIDRILLLENECSGIYTHTAIIYPNQHLSSTLALGTYYFYHNLLRWEHEAYADYYSSLQLATLYQPELTGSTGSSSICQFSQEDSYSFKSLSRIKIPFYDDGVDEEASFEDITVKSIVDPKIEVPLGIGCPTFLKEAKEFPLQSPIKLYYVKVSETVKRISSTGFESVDKHEFTINTTNELSMVTRFKGGHLKESINDYHFGLKYVLIGQDQCQIEPLGMDNDTIAPTSWRSVSFNSISLTMDSWIGQPWHFAGEFRGFWNSTNVTFSIWQSSSKSLSGEMVITTLNMINQTLYNTLFNRATGSSEALSGYIPISVKQEHFASSVSSKPDVSLERQFFNFKRRPQHNQDEYPLKVFGNTFLDKCYENRMVQNMSIYLWLSASDEYGSAVEFKTYDHSLMKKSVLQIMMNHLHISYLRVGSIQLQLFAYSLYPICVEITVFESLDVIDLHTKSHQILNIEPLMGSAVPVESLGDCIRKQSHVHDILYVLSCSVSSKMLCIGLRKGSSLPEQTHNGTVCSIFDNSYDTLSEITKEPSLLDLTNHASRLRGLIILVNHTHYLIEEVKTMYDPVNPTTTPPGHLETHNDNRNFMTTELPANTKTQIEENDEANASTSTQITHKHISDFLVLIIIILIVLSVSLLILYLRDDSHASQFTASELVSLQTIE